MTEIIIIFCSALVQLNFFVTGGFITHSMKLTCSTCIDDITKSGVSNTNSLISIKNRGGLVVPAVKVLDLCILCEKTIRHLLKYQSLDANSPHIIISSTLQLALEKRVLESYSCTSHAARLIRDIVKRYTMIRIRHECKKADLISERRMLNKLILFKHM